MYDYIIVGAGSAGCVLAHRLTEDRRTQVLLLEAGEPDTLSAFQKPLAYLTFLKSPYDWAYSTEPQKQLHQRVLTLSVGKVLGGTSSINSMVYTRGHPLDYDSWRAAGNVGWGYDEVLPYFKKAQHQEWGPSFFHGVDGPINVTTLPPTLLAETFVAAGTELGFPYTPDFNGPSQEGVGFYQLTQKAGQRWSSADGYLRPALERPNLTVLTGALTTQILFEQRRTIGVQYLQYGVLNSVLASREVILCAGALSSPRLLLLSGVGPADHLRSLDIPVVLDLPGVGLHLQDHLLLSHFYSSTRPIPITPAHTTTAGGFVRTQTDLPAPNLQLISTALPPSLTRLHPTQGEAHHFVLAAALIQPQSVGSLTLRTNDPTLPPVLQPNYLSHHADLHTLLAAMKLLRQLAHAQTFASLCDKEIVPGPQVKDNEKSLIEHLRLAASTAYHYSGTCKMGIDSLAVVDPHLCVRGLDGLRVVDASVMPSSVRGDFYAPVVMLAEKAAALLREETPFSALSSIQSSTTNFLIS